MTMRIFNTIIFFQGLASILLVSFTGEVYSQECGTDGTCDTHERCAIWEKEGECYRSPSYMKKVCPISCIDSKIPPRHNDCTDTHNRCPIWAKELECETNASVKKYCKLSCGRCNNIVNDNDDRKKDVRLEKKDEQICEDDHEKCKFWANEGECENNPKYMLRSCKKSCGICTDPVETKVTTKTDPNEDVARMLRKTIEFGETQRVDGNSKEKTLQNIRDMIFYMESSEEFLSLDSKVQHNCKNKNELCSFWAAIGECEANIAFMKVQCAPACKTCHLIDMESRCPELPDAIPGLNPGDLNKMFERITSTAPEKENSDMTDYVVTIHSRPSNESVTEINIDSDKKLPPWVITFDNFLTDEEADSMVQAGYDQGYKRSEDVGSQNFDGTVNSRQSKGRTSENAWCSSRSGCRETTVPKRVMNRISTVIGIPPENGEDFQILKYDVNQFYNTHHDYIPHQRTRQCGPRILTFYLYLSDVEAGGGTDFPDLGITVMPKKGRALLWPSVLNAEPMQDDVRTRHQALPVEAGLKFGANSWIHMFDYQGPQTNGCN